MDKADLMLAEAEEAGDEDELNELKTILYDKHRKGFYVRQRKYDLNDIRLLAECVYSAKFIAEGQARRLVDVVCEFVSEPQAQRIRHNALLTDRVKTDNRGVLNNIAAINEAMSTNIDGQPHTPEQLGLSQSDARTDIYATGVLLNVMLTGKHPTEAFARGRVGRVIRKCTALNPDDRYQSAEKLRAAL